MIVYITAEYQRCIPSRPLLCALSTPRLCADKEPEPLRVKGLLEMKPTRQTLYLALLSALFLFAGTLTLRAAAAQQSGDSTDSSSTKKSSKSKQTPAAAPVTTAPTGAAASTVPATTAKSAPANATLTKPAPPSTPAASKSAATQQTPPANSAGMVWVNTDSGIYHKPGTRYYGKTKQGKYMSEADAIKAGYRAAGKN